MVELAEDRRGEYAVRQRVYLSHTSAAEDPLAIEWTPDLLLAEGRYCPTSAVRSYLESWRRDRQLQWCLLLPFPAGRGFTGFGSLMVFRHESDELSADMQADVARATTDSAARDLAKLLRTVAQSSPASGSGPILSDEQRLALRCARAVGPLAETLLIDTPLALYRPEQWSTESGVRFMILSPDPSPGHGCDAIRPVADDGLATLQTMLNGTRQAVLHQHHRAVSARRSRPDRTPLAVSAPTIDDYLPGLGSGHFGPGHEYDDLLADAQAKSAGALVVAVYLVDREGRRLLRVAGREVNAAADEIPLDSAVSSIALAVQENRPPQIVNGVRSEPILHSTRVPAWIGRGGVPADFSEVVVPIPGTGSGRRQTVIGAFVAQCKSGNGRVFGSHDLAYFEQLANRISLRRADLLFSEATEALAELTGHTMLASAGASDPSRLEPAWHELPLDFANARPFLRRTLQLVYRHTPCVGVALAMLDVKQEKLVRVVEIGEPDLVPESWPRHRPAAGLAGLGCYALHHSEISEVVNVGMKGAFQPFKGAVTSDGWGQLRSGVATPVVVADRSIGVMVVGAAQEHVLGGLRNFVAASAQQLCLSLILAQRAEERRALAFSSSTALHAHEILKRADELRRDPSERVASLGHEIEQLVDVLRTPEGGARLPGSPIEALDEAIEQTGLDYYASWEGDRPELPPFPHATILAVKRAAVEILKNSQLRMVGGRIWIRARVEERAVIPQLLIQLQHCIDQPLAPELLPALYRTPIEDSEGRSARRHYGAFTAGYWMRAVGGDVYLWRNATDRHGRHWIGTAIEVPIFSLAPSEMAP